MLRSLTTSLTYHQSPQSLHGRDIFFKNHVNIRNEKVKALLKSFVSNKASKKLSNSLLHCENGEYINPFFYFKEELAVIDEKYKKRNINSLKKQFNVLKLSEINLDCESVNFKNGNICFFFFLVLFG